MSNLRLSANRISPFHCLTLPLNYWTPICMYEAPLGLTAVSLQCGDEVVRIGFAVLASSRPNKHRYEEGENHSV